MQVPPETISVDVYHGAVVLFSPHLPTVNDPQLRQLPGHITLLTAEEWKHIGKPSTHIIAPSLDFTNIYLVGPGQSKDGQVTWECVVWNEGNRWRVLKELNRRWFHVTTSPRDDHDLDKRLESVEKNIGLGPLVDLLENLSLEGLDEVCRSCAPWQEALRDELAMIMVINFPQSSKGYIQLAKVTFNPKVRQLSFAQALHRNPNLEKKVIRNLSYPFNGSFGPVITETEMDGMPEKLHKHLIKPWPEVLLGPAAERIHRRLWTALTPPRESIFYMGYELPRNFCWIYPFRVAGMSVPRTEEDVDVLEKLGVTDLLSLNKEGPLPKKWFKFKKIKHHYIPIENYSPPTTAEMDVIYDKVAAGGSWVIHCGGGVGRAGTVLACLMTMLGDGKQSDQGMVEDSTGTKVRVPVLHSDEAIRRLRIARPKSIETDEQAAFVSKWVSHRWKLLSQPPPSVEPLKPLDGSSFEGIPIRPNEMINVVLFLIGKPGSGKSWLAEMIVKRRIFQPTIVISQDDCGSKEMCEKEISRERPPKTLIIFDRCNPSITERAIWLKKIPSTRRVIAIYFDFEKAICKQRMEQRVGHPTIRAGRGVKALGEMDEKMEPPTLEEGFKSIVRVESLSAARDVVTEYLALPVQIRKFPRTPHLIDLGAADDDDLLCEIFPRNGKLEGHLTIEEKIDGANLGICLNQASELVVQNRSHILNDTSTGQFKGLRQWIESHYTALHDLLLRDLAFPERYILYGEWCQARHTIPYDSLDDRFLAFDFYDRVANSDCSRRVMDRLLRGTGIKQVPLIKTCDGVTREEVLEMIEGKSAFITPKPGNAGLKSLKGVVKGQGSGASGKENDASASTSVQKESRMEGVYIRFENTERTLTEARGKIVRGDFIRIDDKHWSKRNEIIWNKTKLESGLDPDEGKLDKYGNKWSKDLIDRFGGMGFSSDEDDSPKDPKPMGKERKKVMPPKRELPGPTIILKGLPKGKGKFVEKEEYYAKSFESGREKVKVKVKGKMEAIVEKHVEKVKHREKAIIRNRQGGEDEGWSPTSTAGVGRERSQIPQIRVTEPTPEQLMDRPLRQQQAEGQVGGGEGSNDLHQEGMRDGDDGGEGEGEGEGDEEVEKARGMGLDVVDPTSTSCPTPVLGFAPATAPTAATEPDIAPTSPTHAPETAPGFEPEVEVELPADNIDRDVNPSQTQSGSTIPKMDDDLNELRFEHLSLEDSDSDEEEQEIRDFDQNAIPVWGGLGEYLATVQRRAELPAPQPQGQDQDRGEVRQDVMDVGFGEDDGHALEVVEEVEEEEEDDEEKEDETAAQVEIKMGTRKHLLILYQMGIYSGMKWMRGGELGLEEGGTVRGLFRRWLSMGRRAEVDSG